MQTLITAWLGGSDVVLVSPGPSAVGAQTVAVQRRFVSAMADLATADNLPFVDKWTKRNGSKATKSAAKSSCYWHTRHPHETGYADFAHGPVRLLR